MKEHPEFLQKIDWTLLREQKITLNSSIFQAYNKEKIDKLTGILHLIDAIQDYGVDKMGLSEKEVFNLTPEDENDDFLDKVRSSLRSLLQNTKWSKVLRVNDRTDQLMNIHNEFVNNSKDRFSIEEITLSLFKYEQNLNKEE